MKDKRSILVGVGIGALLASIILIVFFLGIFIGRHESRFFPHFGRKLMGQDVFPMNFGHGAIGTIESLGENTLVIRDRTGALKTVLVDKNTQIRRGHANISFSDLKKNEQVIVLGEPEEKEGVMKARLIRMMGSSDKEATRSGFLLYPDRHFIFRKS